MEKYFQKFGILLVSFGASTPIARQALGHFEDHIRLMFPTAHIRWAFTSETMRSHMAKASKKTDSVHKALARMKLEKIAPIVVQSLHTLPGNDYEQLAKEIKAYAECSISIGDPLLTSKIDIEQVAEALLLHLPKERKKNEAVLCMGHGTCHKAGATYSALAECVAKKDPLVFIETLEAGKGLSRHIKNFNDLAIKKVWLFPLLSIVGKHTLIDMAGKEEHSWQSILSNAGFSCQSIVKGTAEYAEFIHIWADHLHRAVSNLPRHFQ